MRPGSRVHRAAVITQGGRSRGADGIGAALERLGAVATAASVELLVPAEELSKRGLAGEPSDLEDADVAIVLGGDGTMLRALHRFLAREVPVIGVNYGRVGFLASIRPDELERGLERVFAGDYVVTELPTLSAEVGSERVAALNDVVVKSSSLAQMVELGWTVGGEDLGVLPCDGLICCTPSGSTAYNLSNGGPVLVRGLDAMAIAFVAPHSLHARPLVVPRGLDLLVENRTAGVSATILFDGVEFTEVQPGGTVRIELGEEHSLLASLPEVTFFRRYHETFTL